MDCEFCGNKIKELPRKCKYCGHYFCSDHRLPESHNCQGLKQYYDRDKHKLQQTIAELASTHAKVNDRGYEDIVNIKSHEDRQKYKETNVRSLRQTSNSSNNIDSFFKRKYYQTTSWLQSRRHRNYYFDWKGFFMNILWIVVLSITFVFIYLNLTTLNEIILWFLPLGTILLFVNAFFWISLFLKLLKKTYYWYRGERNWVQYLILILFIFLLLLGFKNKDVILDNAREIYDKINVSSILPLGLFEDISRSITEVINPEPISDKTNGVEKAIFD